MQESDQHEEAPKAYRRANEVSPDQPLAWQGLVSYCEKHKKTITPDVEEDLLKAYAHLIPLDRFLWLKVSQQCCFVCVTCYNFANPFQ